MEIREEIRKKLDDYYQSIHINDFSSFIKSDFRDGQLFDLSEERAQTNIRESRAMIRRIDGWLGEQESSWEEQTILKICRDFCEYIIRNGEYYWYKFNLTHNTTPLPYVVKRLETYPLERAADLEFYEELLGQFPEKLRGMLQKLWRQKEKGIRMPAEQAEIVIRLLESLICTPDTELKPWNRADVKIPVPEAARQRIEKETEALNDTLRQMIREIRSDYLPGRQRFFRDSAISGEERNITASRS